MIVGLIDLLAGLFIWCTFIVVLIVLIRKIGKILNHQDGVKDWLILILASLYIVGFIFLRVFFSDVFKMIAGIAFGLVAIISYQLDKYEDRAAGKRWWED